MLEKVINQSNKARRKIVNSLKENAGLLPATAILLAGRAVDIASTYLGIKLSGNIAIEGNENALELMRAYGTETGILLHQIPLVLGALAIGCAASFAYDSEMKRNDKKYRHEIENYALTDSTKVKIQDFLNPGNLFICLLGTHGFYNAVRNSEIIINNLCK